jgi:hypothetical protein
MTLNSSWNNNFESIKPYFTSMQHITSTSYSQKNITIIKKSDHSNIASYYRYFKLGI